MFGKRDLGSDCGGGRVAFHCLFNGLITILMMGILGLTGILNEFYENKGVW